MTKKGTGKADSGAWLWGTPTFLPLGSAFWLRLSRFTISALVPTITHQLVGAQLVRNIPSGKEKVAVVGKAVMEIMSQERFMKK